MQVGSKAPFSKNNTDGRMIRKKFGRKSTVSLRDMTATAEKWANSIVKNYRLPKTLIRTPHVNDH